MEMLQKLVPFILSASFLVLFVAGQAQKPFIYAPYFMPLQVGLPRGHDPMRITYLSSRRLEVENLSDKIIRSFVIKVFAAGDDRTPVKVIQVGNRTRKNLQIIKPNESLSIPITRETFETFIKHSKPLLHIQLAEILFSYDDSDGIFERDRNYEPGYRVMIEMK